ncbi:MAG: LemA family protein [Planctomycetaceae bacterium]|jgi:hypothetical protein|nr:LemA family protein [Planctomycetaceae bacterium]
MMFSFEATLFLLSATFLTATSPNDNIAIAIPVVFALVMLLLWGSLSALKQRRLLEDLPTSKTTGVFIGLVELKGTAESENPLRCFLAERPCVWYSWTVQEHWSRTIHETYRDANGKMQTRTRQESGWTTVASGGDAAPFYLQDDCGVVRINPAKAKIHAVSVFHKTVSKWDPIYYDKGPACGVANSTGKRCFAEEAVSLHQPIYVVGQAREREDCVAAEVGYDSKAPLFLISTKTEESHRAWGLFLFWSLGILAVLLPTGLGIGLTADGNDPMSAIGIPAALGGGTLAVWGIGWLWTVYNSLIGLKNRVKMATANVDVEIKRRFDLIPQLIRVLEGMKQHERSLLESVVLLRNQGAMHPLEEQTVLTVKGCAKQLIELVENYPELKTNELFLTLQENLIATEQRIALARNYYNDVIETHNNRRERFPENIIAVLAGMKPIPLLQIEDIERNNIEVQLVR